jgi:hypothetical protein
MRTAHGIAVALSAGFRLATAAPCGAESSLLYVTSYPIGSGAGKVLTLKLDHTKLETVAESDSCGPYPAWLTPAGNILYCVNEAWGGEQGDLAALKVGDDLSLTKLSGGKTVAGPVSTIVYGDGGRGLAIAD